MKKSSKNNDSKDSDDEIFDIDVKMDEKNEKNDKDEKDDKDARMEMKTILKTMLAKFDLDYDQMFMSKINVNIRMNSLKLNFNPTYDQLTKWLMSLYKSRRSKNNYKKKKKLDSDDCHLHANERINDKKIRRLKAAKTLYNKDNRLSELKTLLKEVLDSYLFKQQNAQKMAISYMILI
ncbi:hypothetical protein C1646_749651 [Rhizophagus diaphanus]|nr:hypothetical protein C1646_749651 [Rhizophagus diaphanus] [Rhizophagus sp. MUCL 43196]